MLILRSPSLMHNYSGIPPFGLATITAELKSKGFDIEQDDLDAKCAADELFPRHRWGKQFPAKDLMLDIERMRQVLGRDADADVVDVVEQVLTYTDVNGKDTILLSCIEGDDVAAVLALCIGKYLRDRLGKVVIVGGEAFPHMMPIKSEIGYFYQHGCFDYYIQGYGEAPLLDLFAALDADGPLDDVRGLVYPKPDGTLIENRPLFTRPEVVPDFEGLPMDLYYKFPNEWGKLPTEDEGIEEILVLPVKLNFCCPMNCAFCISSGDAFSKVTLMNPDAMAVAIKGLKERHGTRRTSCSRTTCSTSASATRRRWPRRSCVTTSGIMWSDCAYGKHLTRDSLQLFRASGACRLVWGLETGSRRLQKLIHKGIDLDEFAQILEWSP